MFERGPEKTPQSDPGEFGEAPRRDWHAAKALEQEVEDTEEEKRKERANKLIENSELDIEDTDDQNGNKKKNAH